MNQEQLIKEVLEIVKIACTSAIQVYLHNIETLSDTQFKKAYSKMLNAIKSNLEGILPLDGEMLNGLIKVSLNEISSLSGNKRIYKA